MFRKSKRVVGLLVILLLLLPIMSTVHAAETTTTPDIKITTDKDVYSGDDDIKVTVSVKNTTNSYLNDLMLRANAPEGYGFADTKAKADDWTYDIGKLALGEEISTSVTFVKNAEVGENTTEEVTSETATTEKGDSSVNTSTGNVAGDNNVNSSGQPTTGDKSNIGLYVALCMLTAGVMVVLIKSKKIRNLLSLFVAVMMVMSLCKVGTIDAKAAATSDKEITATKDITVDGKSITIKIILTKGDDGLSYEGYTQVWGDEFEGTTLNLNDWNVEGHEPGWVNAELQRYPYENEDYSKNIYLEDGKLVIKPIKTVNDDGSVSYSSGRINTQGNKEFTYGMFEARVKVPEGKGYLPAFWLMAADENVYGQWPRCGEIDIMEVHGSETDKSYGTIHYGNPHMEQQGTYTLKDESYSDEYHTFTVEWEPGSIKWYMDGELFHSANDWYSATEGQGEVTYPAPFDQPFYVILNLAVGGSWVGYPDDTTDFENAAYEIDYVRVYQKDSYDENVTKPEKEVILRDPDSTGNYVINGNFAVAENLGDSEDWIFLTAQEGVGAAEISNNKINITTTNSGVQDYSIQLVQPNLPMKQGATYEVTFDAYADEARTMKVDVSAPDRSYIRYMPDTVVDLGTTKKSYSYSFTMTGKDDANGRLEFNMGNTGSMAGVHIENVAIKMTDYEEVVDDGSKVMLADGNYVYNGSFQEGTDRMQYWEIDNKANATLSVTSLSDGRKLKIVVPEGATSENPLVIGQSKLALVEGSSYALSYDIQGDAGKNVSISVSGQAPYSVSMTGAVQSGNIYKFKQLAGDVKSLEFTFTEPGTYYLDNVRIDEDSLIKNGSFNAGLAGFEPFVDGSASANYVVDSLTENNAVDFTISDTGDEGWKIQLKQNNVELEEGQWYRLSFDAKSSINRKLMFAIQRDGNKHGNDWTPYSGEKIVDLTADYQKYSVEFKMAQATDLESVLSISMGAVGGTQIKDSHRICIDNILLEKIEEPEIVGNNLLVNGDFSKGDAGWSSYVGKEFGAEGTVAIADKKATVSIDSVGTADWNIQLKQEGIKLEKGKSYTLTFKALSTITRYIKPSSMDTGNAKWYGGGEVKLEAGVEKTVTVTITTGEFETDTNAYVQIGMGLVNVEGDPCDLTQAHTITLSDFKLIENK